MQKKPQVNVVLYARDPVGGKKGSTQAQLDRLTSLVKDREREGWTVGEKLVDRGRGGFTADRPAFRKLLKLLRSGKIDVVAVTRIDRLSRNVRDFARLVGELDGRSVRLISLSGLADIPSILRVLAETKKRRRNEC
jgi:DNA invertase Pin-like site-specific DNA recombinase